jgi:hypothetical protein
VEACSTISVGPEWRVHPEQAAAGQWTSPTDLARYLIELERAAEGRSNRVLSRQLANEMPSPVSIGDFVVRSGRSNRPRRVQRPRVCSVLSAGR